MMVEIEVEVEDPAWAEALPDVAALADAAATLALEDRAGAVTVLLADDAAVKDLNARFRGQDKATNVLSFPAADNPEGHVGDLALAFGVCAREASEQGKPLAHHLQHLVIHGALHLIGYDHVDDGEAERMEALERELLARLGIPDPYGEREGDHVQP
ncbi:MAG TPA: rRNA maturation RNase YbeY [Caulobacteraceae bacterium]|nr:rRNA maturation RNase YbeY [Caulobacteraceae bacterium]